MQLKDEVNSFCQNGTYKIPCLLYMLYFHTHKNEKHLWNGMPVCIESEELSFVMVFLRKMVSKYSVRTSFSFLGLLKIGPNTIYPDLIIVLEIWKFYLHLLTLQFARTFYASWLLGKTQCHWSVFSNITLKPSGDFAYLLTIYPSIA